MDKIERLECENAVLRNKLDKEEAIIQKLEGWNHNSYMNGIIAGGKVSASQSIYHGIFQNQLVDFAVRYTDVYIYGAGRKAIRISNELMRYGIDFRGFLVSPGEQIKPNNLNRPVHHVNEVRLDGDVGVIIALNRQNTISAMPYIIDAKIGTIFLAQ